jgi:hypothetical protein
LVGQGSGGPLPSSKPGQAFKSQKSQPIIHTIGDIDDGINVNVKQFFVKQFIVYGTRRSHIQ